jgi:hypothetical protein
MSSYFLYEAHERALGDVRSWSFILVVILIKTPWPDGRSNRPSESIYG